MENNKSYLGKIHWTFLIAILYSIYSLFGVAWLYQYFGEKSLIAFLLSTLLYVIFYYVPLGIVTSKWKQAFIGAGVMLLISVLYHELAGNQLSLILIYFLYPLHFLVFTGLQSGWKSKLLKVYGLVLFLSITPMLNSFASRQMADLTRMITDNYEIGRETYLQGYSFFFGIAEFLFLFIYKCELLNYATRTYREKSITLNLGNEIQKLNGIITFWVMRTMLLILVVGGSMLVQTFYYTLRADSFFQNPIGIYMKIIMLMSIPGVITIALFTGWYTRKLLLENFIIYNIRSKFLYWFSMLPLVGFFAYLVLLTNTTMQNKYSDRKASLHAFADNNTSGVTITIFIFLALELLVALMNGAGPNIALVLVSGLLFTWLMYDKSAYYISIGFVGVSVIVAFITSIFIKRGMEDVMEQVVSFLLLNMTYLVLLLPVYHIDTFEYTPAEDPDGNTAPKEDLF